MQHRPPLAPRDRGAVIIETDKGSSTSGGGREPITLPEWLPPAVAKQARRIETRCSSDEQRAILLRLATDTRMRGVWAELTRRKRSDGGFLHPAKRPMDKPALTQEEVQAEALGWLFFFAFCAARDQVPVWKPEELTDKKTETLLKARILRELADELATEYSTELFAVADAAALRRVAKWLETLVVAARGPSDPLMIQKGRGDRRVRSVQIRCAAQLIETFGKRLDRTAAALAAVALDQETSERVTRSAFSSRK